MRQCCTDHNGNPKQKYETQEEAENAAKRGSEKGVAISVYPCEEGDGWHLTSRNAPPLERPITVMTKEEKKLYTRKNKNRIGSLLNKEIVEQMKNEARNNTLPILKKNIEPLQLKFDEIYKEFAQLRKKYRLAEREKEDVVVLRELLVETQNKLNVAKQELRAAKNEYESGKRRIERLRQ